MSEFKKGDVVLIKDTGGYHNSIIGKETIGVIYSSPLLNVTDSFIVAVGEELLVIPKEVLTKIPKDYIQYAVFSE